MGHACPSSSVGSIIADYCMPVSELALSALQSCITQARHDASEERRLDVWQLDDGHASRLASYSAVPPCLKLLIGCLAAAMQ